jgi:hypothetical protein
MRRSASLFFCLLIVFTVSTGALRWSRLDRSIRRPSSRFRRLARAAMTRGTRSFCDTTLNFYPVNEPAFDAPCGMLYLTGTELRDGTRFYTDGLITPRHVVGAMNGTLTLSPTGDGPYVEGDPPTGTLGACGACQAAVRTKPS